MSKDRKFLPEVDGLVAGVFARSIAAEAQVRDDKQRQIAKICDDPAAVRAVARAFEVSERSRRAGPTRS